MYKTRRCLFNQFFLDFGAILARFWCDFSSANSFKNVSDFRDVFGRKSLIFGLLRGPGGGLLTCSFSPWAPNFVDPPSKMVPRPLQKASGTPQTYFLIIFG